MNTKQIGRNQVVLTTNHCDEILYSYNEPVAGYSYKIGWFRVSEYATPATQMHLARYLKRVTNITVLTPVEIVVMFLQGE